MWRWKNYDVIAKEVVTGVIYLCGGEENYDVIAKEVVTGAIYLCGGEKNYDVITVRIACWLGNRSSMQYFGSRRIFVPQILFNKLFYRFLRQRNILDFFEKYFMSLQSNIL